MEKKEKKQKQKRKQKMELPEVLTVISVIVSVLICAGLTVLHMMLQYETGIKKIDATFTGLLFADVVAFAFLGILITYAIRKLILAKAKKQ